MSFKQRTSTCYFCLGNQLVTCFDMACALQHLQILEDCLLHVQCATLPSLPLTSRTEKIAQLSVSTFMQVAKCSRPCLSGNLGRRSSSRSLRICISRSRLEGYASVIRHDQGDAIVIQRGGDLAKQTPYTSYFLAMHSKAVKSIDALKYLHS